MAEVTVLIVNWNTRDFLRDCLRSVYAHTTCDLDVTVVDNASTDGSSAMVRNEFSQVHLVQNDSNVGFAAANNQILCNPATRYMLLLNSDTYVDPGAIDLLKQFMDEHPDVGAVGPKVVHPQGRLRVLSCGCLPSVRTLFNQYFFLSAVFPHVRAFRGVNLRIGVHDDYPRPVEWLSGACLLVRREVVEQVGPLSEQWFMYAEDHEWCWRMGLAGWKLFHVPQATIKHHFGASSIKSKLTNTMWVESTRSFYRYRSSPSRMRLLAFDVVLALGLAFRMVIYWVLGHTGGDNAEVWRTEARIFGAYCRAALRPDASARRSAPPAAPKSGIASTPS